MRKKVSTSNLKKLIAKSEDILEKGQNRRKNRKIRRALEDAYRLLNNEVYTEEDVKKQEKKILFALSDEPSFVNFVLICAFLLFVSMFVVYQSYIFINNNWNKIYDVSEIVDVQYDDGNMVELDGNNMVPDRLGIQNIVKTFKIESLNSYEENYIVDYTINIVEKNENINDGILDKKDIKYQISYTTNDGKEVIEEIKTFAQLKRNSDGTYEIFRGKQTKGDIHKYSVALWISSKADYRDRNKRFNFEFVVKANVHNA